MNLYLIILLYLIVINLIGFAFMGIDKSKARRQAFRIPESNLFLIAVIGGSIGSIVGMYFFRHKTQHLSFVIGMPVILGIQILLCIWLFVFSPFTFKIM